MKGEYEASVRETDLKFPVEIEECKGEFTMYSLEGRLVIRNIERHNQKAIVRFFDTKGNKVVQEAPEEAFRASSNPLVWLF